MNSMRTRPLMLLAVLLACASCEYTYPTLRMLVTDYQHFAPDDLQAIIEDQSRIRFSVADVAIGRAALDALAEDETDLALVENSSAFVPGVRAILPVYESTLHIAASQDYLPDDIQRPLQGANFYVPNGSAAGAKLISLITHRQGLEPGQYRISPTFEEGKTNFIIYFGPINPDNTGWMREGFELVSLDNNLNPQRKFYEEGIGYTAPNMKPKVIPALTYELPGNEEALLTVAVDTLLVTRKEVSEETIYELTRTFLEQKPRFMAIAPHLFSGINESFDPLDLSFPLHKGARSYLERDEPGFLERYAETINMLVYVTFLLISAFLAFARWREHKKKDRIDVFYERIFAVRDTMQDNPPGERLEALNDIEREAFESLIREKLAANESFRIFTDLLARTRSEIKLEE